MVIVPLHSSNTWMIIYIVFRHHASWNGPISQEHPEEQRNYQNQQWCVVCESTQACTCSGAHAPGRQAVRRGEAVEDADVLWCQELHELGVLEDVPFAVQDAGGLVGNVDNPARVERHCYCKDVLEISLKKKLAIRWHRVNKMTEEVNEEELWVFSPRVKLFKASHCFWGCIRRWCCLSLQWYKRKHPGQKVGCHWSSVAGNIPHWLQDTIIVRLQGSTRGRGKEKLLLLKVNLFTFHLFDAAQSVLQGVQCGRLVIVPLPRGQVTLELFQGFN